jgi:predicted lysophospholipase L1 biosynthesis ABC-type transport system permease subunit
LETGTRSLICEFSAVEGVARIRGYGYREVGIRVALGARKQEVLRAELGRVFVLLSVRSAAGMVLGILASKVLAFIVYQTVATCRCGRIGNAHI